jgi:hypothetical protein
MLPALISIIAAAAIQLASDRHAAGIVPSAAAPISDSSSLPMRLSSAICPRSSGVEQRY